MGLHPDSRTRSSKASPTSCPNVDYFDSWNTFAAADGGYSAFYRDGTKVREIRAPDGVHFNTDGYALLVEKAAQLATRDFNLDPKTYGP